MVRKVLKVVLVLVLTVSLVELSSAALPDRRETHLIPSISINNTEQRTEEMSWAIKCYSLRNGAPRGCQFTSDEYQRFLNGHNLVCSMSAVGCCADNALVEGFFGMLKRERFDRRQYMTRAEARADIFDYIERFYNPRMRRKLENTENNELELNSTVRNIGT